jgi:hypothetical protein
MLYIKFVPDPVDKQFREQKPVATDWRIALEGKSDYINNLIRSYSVNVSATYKNTFKHLFPSISLSSDVVNKLECLCINVEILFVDAHELCHP